MTDSATARGRNRNSARNYYGLGMTQKRNTGYVQGKQLPVVAEDARPKEKTEVGEGPKRKG